PEANSARGMGGPAGGALYYATAPGVRWWSDPRGPVIVDADIDVGHGFPPEEPDMWTAFCAEGGEFARRRIGAVRTTVVAPTVAQWLGIPAPAHAGGPCRHGEQLGRA